MEIKLRKHQHALTITGFAVILFGIWDYIKTILHILVIKPIANSIRDIAGLDYDEYGWILLIISVVIVIVILAVSFLIRFRIGRTAIALGRGEKPRTWYMIPLIMIVLLPALLGYGSAVNMFREERDILDLLASMLTETTSVIMLVAMLWNMHMVRKLTAQMEAGGENAD